MATQASDVRFKYGLGYTTAEQERLIRQAAMVAPVTERLFRAAGIGLGHRVLDLGSGMGDVAMLVARLVGPAGGVVGIERDAGSVAQASARVAEAGLRNVQFKHADVRQLDGEGRFDAAVGRFILGWVPDPVGVLRCLSPLVRPGGVIAFQESSFAPYLVISAHLPLWSAAASLLREVLERCGANPETGLVLHRIFQDAGLPAPTMHMEMLLGNDPDFTGWTYDVLHSLRVQNEQLEHCFEALGDFDTLRERLNAEVTTSKSIVGMMALIGAWCRKADDKA